MLCCECKTETETTGQLKEVWNLCFRWSGFITVWHDLKTNMKQFQGIPEKYQVDMKRAGMWLFGQLGWKEMKIRSLVNHISYNFV